MSEFHVLAIPICFVLGVGIIKKSSTALVRRSAGGSRLDWLPFTWAFVILTVLSTAVVVFSSRRVWQAAATLVFVAIQMYGILFVWSRPDYVF